ncbi:protein charybde [Tribolium castaneum]|uniref:Protein charybde-like Protein n=1 Tax=Tribolium castaneum TaxID=7070 RepID=D6WVR5_TRICA|nr:PREDICTED: protein charybde [Tribolium castaneum]EFA08258.1 Protein charybde-like Protein [Tribolium castaneum]|eukprot:XP_967998.1 PREDICTED: protein charybde [Tribolium castaneum]
MEIITLTNQFNNNVGESEVVLDSEVLAVEALAKRFGDELKKAKRAHFACGEVLLPADLTRALAKDVLAKAETEPCGLKGCTIFINFESGEERRRLSVVNCDPSTPTTFELYLTLRQNVNGWNHFLPQFLKKMTRSGTVMISSEYDLQKKKLYRSYDD